MGRNSTGAWTTRESLRIDLSYLIKQGFIKKGCHITGFLSWSNGSNIEIDADFTRGNMKVKLSYCTTDRDGSKENYRYYIRIAALPSNLGKGEVLYFICPVSGRRCKILYKAYGSDVWKCREAYNNRIYYPLQLSSQKNRYNDRYWHLDAQLEKLSTMRNTYTYNGKPTRRALRIEGIENARNRADSLRWSFANLPVYIQRSLQRNGTNVFN